MISDKMRERMRNKMFKGKERTVKITEAMEGELMMIFKF